MNPSDIGKAYNQITHLWQREEFNRSNGIVQHKRALAFTKGRGKALDVGCGCTGRFIDLLNEESFTVEGLDISEEMIRLARERHPDVTFYYQDICQYQLSEQYDFITAWDSIWHVPLTEQQTVITKLIKALNPGGVFIFSFGGLDEADEHTDDFMGAEVYYSSLGTTGFLETVNQAGAVCRHLEYDQHPEMHTYMIVQKV